MSSGAGLKGVVLVGTSVFVKLSQKRVFLYFGVRDIEFVGSNFQIYTSDCFDSAPSVTRSSFKLISCSLFCNRHLDTHFLAPGFFPL